MSLSSIVSPVAGRPNVRFLSDSDVERVFGWPEAIACLAAAYGAALDPGMTPPRVVARGDRVWLRALAAVSPSGRYMGAKLFGQGRKKQVSYLIALFDQETGALACLIDARHITAARTAATSALAVDRLAPRAPLAVAVLGSGAEAQAHLDALATVRELRSVAIFSPTPASREGFAHRAGARLRVECRAVASAEQAVAGADLVVAAARSCDETPILLGAWLAPGMTVVSIGSTLPEQREIDPEVVRRADLVVADAPEEVMHDTGDMIAARKAGIDCSDRLVSLADLVSGRSPGRRGPRDIVLYKSVGSALQDVAVAEMCLERAAAQGRGSELPAGLSIKVLK